MWTLSLADTPLFVNWIQANTNTPYCWYYFPGCILLPLPVVSQGASQLFESRRQECDGSPSHHLHVSGSTDVCFRHLCPTLSYGSQAGIVMCELIKHNHNLHYAAWPWGHEPTSDYCNYNSPHFCLSITSAICPSAIHLQVQHSHSLALLIIIGFRDILIDKYKERKTTFNVYNRCRYVGLLRHLEKVHIKIFYK